MLNIQPDGVINLYTALAFVIADTIALALRIFSKHKTTKRLRSDDWWICASLGFFYIWCGLIMYTMAGMEGTIVANLLRNPEDLQKKIKFLWISTFFFPLTITATKISILCFYRSIFTIRLFRITTYGITMLCVLWCFLGLFFIAFQCKPIEAAWDLRLAPTAKCYPYGALIFGMEVSNLILDVAILAVPTFVISTLHLDTRRKILLTSIFLLGGFVIITCIMRIVTCYDPHTPQFVPDPGKATLWTTVQTGTAIICACLPIYRPLFSQPHVLSTKFKSWNSSLRNRSQSRKSKTNAPSSNPSNANAFDRRDNGWKGSSETPLVDAKSTTLCPASDEVELSYPMNAIAVETRIDIV